MISARGSAYYDASYERIIRLKDPVVWGLMRERCEKIAPYIAGKTMLDVACGIGILSLYSSAQIGETEFMDGSRLTNHRVLSYTGVDFSPVAIEHATNKYSSAEFIEDDVFKFLLKTERRFDTVILSEILEHVAQPARLYEMAAAVANKRIIWTVPCNLPAPAHVWPVWPEQAVDLMLSLVDGECVVKERFGGDDGGRWWIVVQDVERKIPIDV